eukprot:TRINITY_DN6616_c0_g1_i1.p1 TRINITY_DN6616_c0_g1~~TRINITY_DN6616_c0_g1_i1.p1  ORF type:complete len:200 (+),score=-18.22 TRINITY_DN6616_c0_g1_i1:417-1016(+)
MHHQHKKTNLLMTVQVNDVLTSCGLKVNIILHHNRKFQMRKVIFQFQNNQVRGIEKSQIFYTSNFMQVILPKTQVNKCEIQVQKVQISIKSFIIVLKYILRLVNIYSTIKYGIVICYTQKLNYKVRFSRHYSYFQKQDSILDLRYKLSKMIRNRKILKTRQNFQFHTSQLVVNNIHYSHFQKFQYQDTDSEKGSQQTFF